MNSVGDEYPKKWYKCIFEKNIWKERFFYQSHNKKRNDEIAYFKIDVNLIASLRHLESSTLVNQSFIEYQSYNKKGEKIFKMWPKQQNGE